MNLPKSKIEQAPQGVPSFQQDCTLVYSWATGTRLKRLWTCYRTPGLHALAVYRFGNWLGKRSLMVRWTLEPLYILLFHRVRTKWGIEISRSASIGPGCYIGHFGGIVIGPAIIGQSCSISQGVTIGVSGRGEKEGLPTIGDNVYIGPGAKLFGKITIGHNVKIGANAVVYKDVEDNAVVAAPGFVVLSHEGNKRSTTKV